MSTSFFQELRRTIMVRGEGWKAVIENLPSHVSFSKAKDLLQTKEQLLVLEGQGHIAGEMIDAQFKEANVTLKDGLNLENITLQWIYRFVLVESFCEHNRRDPLKKWAPMFLHMTEEGLHFMVCMATLLVLLEEGQKISSSAEHHIRERVTRACNFSISKTEDYGESFRRHGLPGLLPRLWDKIARYSQLKADNRPGNFETVLDSAHDLLGYCCIAYSLMLELPQELRNSYQPTSVYETNSNVMAGAEWQKTK